MLRVTVVQSLPTAALLHIEGRIAGPWVEELRAACEPHLRGRVRLSLDLADISFADAAGIALLRDLRNRGVVFTGTTPLVIEQLKGGPQYGAD